MKFLLASLYYYPTMGGVENSIRYLAKHLLGQGHDVRILSFDKKSASGIEEVDGIKVYRSEYVASYLPGRNYRNIVKAASRTIENILSDFYPDQIWTRNSAVSYGIVKSSFRNRIVHIFSTTARLNVEGLYQKSVVKQSMFIRLRTKVQKEMDFRALSHIEKRIVRNNKVAPVVLSMMMKDQLLKETGFDGISVVSPGIDLSRFNNCYDETQQRDLIQEYPQLEAPYILYVGRLAKAKNIEILIDSMAFVEAVNLVLVGDGPYANDLKYYVSNKSFSGRIIFIGKQNKLLPLIYSRSLITVLPTKIETFGQVFLESLACGTPVVGFGNNPEFRNATREIIKEDENGTIVSNYSAIDLGIAMNNLIKKVRYNPNKISSDCINDVKERFNWDQTVRRLIDIGKV